MYGAQNYMPYLKRHVAPISETRILILIVKSILHSQIKHEKICICEKKAVPLYHENKKLHKYSTNYNCSDFG